MFDMMHVAFQTDTTRVFTFQMARELSQRIYPEIGCLDPHHAMSHHRNEPLLLAANARLQTVSLQPVREVRPEAEATRRTATARCSITSILQYGSGMSDSNAHSHHDLPIVVVGGGAGTVKGNRHLAYPIATPLANLHVAYAHKFGLDIQTFGDSNGVDRSVGRSRQTSEGADDAEACWQSGQSRP